MIGAATTVFVLKYVQGTFGRSSREGTLIIYQVCEYDLAAKSKWQSSQAKELSRYLSQLHPGEALSLLPSWISDRRMLFLAACYIHHRIGPPCAGVDAGISVEYYACTPPINSSLAAAPEWSMISSTRRQGAGSRIRQKQDRTVPVSRTLAVD